jgi:biotin carboxyl carrier protein
MAMSERLRLTVLGDPDLVVELDPPADGREGVSRQLLEVRDASASAEERASGQAVYEVTGEGWVFRVRTEPAARAALRERARRGAAAGRTHVREHVRARIPGRVVRVWVEPGQTVEAGERLLAVEAMKMENEVRSPRAGVVVSIAVQPGQPVELGSELLTLD